MPILAGGSRAGANNSVNSTIVVARRATCKVGPRDAALIEGDVDAPDDLDDAARPPEVVVGLGGKGGADDPLAIRHAVGSWSRSEAAGASAAAGVRPAVESEASGASLEFSHRFTPTKTAPRRTVRAEREPRTSLVVPVLRVLGAARAFFDARPVPHA